MAERERGTAPAQEAPVDLDQECELMDWARTAGVSSESLRKAVREASKLAKKDRV